MTPNQKEVTQYATAVVMLLSGIILAFLSFFMNNYTISHSVLLYISQALVYAGGIFGISAYFRTKLGEFETRAERRSREYIDKQLNKTNEE